MLQLNWFLPSSIYMQAIEWLLEVKAIPFTERALGIQLLIASKEGGPTADYHIAMARLKLQKRELADAEEELNEALQLDYQVRKSCNKACERVSHDASFWDS